MKGLKKLFSTNCFRPLKKNISNF